jgi:hypothetical protein
MGVGKPSERELRCLANARAWAGLIPFVALFEKPEPKKKRTKPEYDWRVVIANAQGRH